MGIIRHGRVNRHPFAIEVDHFQPRRRAVRLRHDGAPFRMVSVGGPISFVLDFQIAVNRCRMVIVRRFRTARFLMDGITSAFDAHIEVVDDDVSFRINRLDVLPPSAYKPLK